MYVWLRLVLLFSLLSCVLLHPLAQGQTPETHAQPQSRVKRDKPEESLKTVKQRASSGCLLSTCSQHHLLYALYLLRQGRLKDPSPPEGKMDKYG